MRTQFLQDINPIEQKSRRIPIHLQERVEAELNKLKDQKLIKKLDEFSDKQFISPMVIMFKKDQIVKLALESNKINNFIHKKKHQMTNIDFLLDNIAQIIKADEKQKIIFTALDFVSHIHKSRDKEIRPRSFQLDRRKSYRNIPFPNVFLRPHGYAGTITEGHLSHINKL